jgi:3-keto-L-gulonate-6-phosphate decarboxylase
VPPTGTDGTTPDTGSPGGCADGAADCSPQPSTPPPPSAHTTPTAPSTGGGGGGIVGWITSGITSAINSFFRGLVTAALDPLLDLLGKTLLTTPMPSQIPAIGESTSLPAGLLASLLSMGQDSPHWLARREAAALADDQQLAGRRHLSAPSRPEAFRRLRGQRRIQIALDVRDTDQAVTVAKAVAEAGLDFVEVGDPLIKQAGVGVIEHIKRQVPDLTVVAEMMSADWGRDQVELAAEAGADVVFLIGPATEASVSAAVAAGRRLGVPIVLDVPKLLGSPRWVHDMERAGVDGFAITTNIDLGVVGHQPMSGARILRGWTQLPVAVSGGFSATDYTPLASSDWDILIVGRAVTEAVNPTVAATRLAQAVSRLAPKEDQ